MADLNEYLLLIEDTVNKIRAEYVTDPENKILYEQIEPGRVKISGDFDEVIYMKDGKSYTASDYISITNPTIIGNLSVGKWFFSVQKSGKVSQNFVIAVPEKEVPATPTLRPLKWVGFWDHDMIQNNGAGLKNDVSIIKTMSVDNISEVAGQGAPIIAYIGLAGKNLMSNHDWRKRLENKKQEIDKYKDQIFGVMLFDEPYKAEVTQQMIFDRCRIAREVFPDYVIMSSMKAISADKMRPVPLEVDWISINYYRDRRDEWHAKTDEEYKNIIRGLIDKVRSHYPGNIMIVGQGFGGIDSGKYAKPRTNAPQLIQEVGNEKGIEMVLWFKYAPRDGWHTVSSMPELYKNIIKTTT